MKGKEKEAKIQELKTFNYHHIPMYRQAYSLTNSAISPDNNVRKPNTTALSPSASNLQATAPFIRQKYVPKISILALVVQYHT